MRRNRATHSYEYNAICDVCGFKFKASELRKRWDGYMVCKHDFEFRHPLDFYTTRNDTHVLPWTRPDPTPVEIGPEVQQEFRITSPDGDFRVTTDGSYREVA